MQVMKWSVIALAVAAGTTQMAVASQQSDSKGFVDDSSLNLLLRNTYWNRDYNKGVDDRKTWGQAFITTFESGFTQGTVGFGVDAFGLLGLKLDGGQDDMFELKSNGHRTDDVAQAGAAVKVQFSNTVIKYGNQMPSLPVLAYDDSRLLPQSFTGTLITSNEIEGLELNVGRFTQDSSMASSSSDSGELKKIDVYGGSYKFTDDLSVALYASDIEDVAKKKYANVNYQIPLSDEQSLAFDFNIYKTKYDREFVGDAGDKNTIFSLAGTYAFGAHALTLAYQQNSGDAGYAYDIGDGGSAIFLANSYYSDFNAEDEKSVQLAYDLDFSAYGVPGLTWRSAYVYGYNIDTATGDAKEREIFNQVKYTVQSGPAKDLALKARNSIYRADNSYGTDLNEWRLFIEYPISIL
ncbi:OprD family outer membrane porin [Pseudomonas kuykendallii]|uniref:OprD family outer membrane porin n=1 Tax=Pseudomonas kuykendallii TaxID=1007099 RepID=UPI0028A023EF|nr:OprD family outer membrane porin [Pseudomonas kuykendallii]